MQVKLKVINQKQSFNETVEETKAPTKRNVEVLSIDSDGENELPQKKQRVEEAESAPVSANNTSDQERLDIATLLEQMLGVATSDGTASFTEVTTPVANNSPNPTTPADNLANEFSPILPPLPKLETCRTCGKTGHVKKCSRCKTVYYCSMYYNPACIH